MFRSECKDRKFPPPPNFYDKKTRTSGNYCLKSVLIEENIAADIDQDAACCHQFDARADDKREERAEAHLDSTIQIIAIVEQFAHQSAHKRTDNDADRAEAETSDSSDGRSDCCRSATTEDFGHICRQEVVDNRDYGYGCSPNPKQCGRECRAFAEECAKQACVAQDDTRKYGHNATCGTDDRKQNGCYRQKDLHLLRSFTLRVDLSPCRGR